MKNWDSVANAASIRAGMLLSCGCSIRADMFVFSEQSYFPSWNCIMVFQLENLFFMSYWKIICIDELTVVNKVFLSWKLKHLCKLIMLCSHMILCLDYVPCHFIFLVRIIITRPRKRRWRSRRKTLQPISHHNNLFKLMQVQCQLWLKSSESSVLLVYLYHILWTL